MRVVLDAIEGEYRRYKSLAEGAINQLSDEDLLRSFGDGNSVATLMKHLGGNLESRFSGFPLEDGEKPWRDREGEFAHRDLSRDELVAIWEGGWHELIGALAGLSDVQLGHQVTIRGVSLSIVEALARSVAHTSYHVGQIVLIARGIRGADWKFLSIPPGGSATYNQNPTREKPPK